MTLLLKNLLFTLLVPGTVVVLGWAALHPAAAGALLSYAALVAIVAHTFVVRYEEPKLRALFGAEYDAYAARVDRWRPRPSGCKPV